jgi:hypothetical protein
MGLRVHHVPGRVRLYLPWLKGNLAGAKEVQERVSKMPGVLRVEARELTGSVLMYYDPEVARVVDLIASAAQNADWKDVSHRPHTAAVETGTARFLADFALKKVAELALSAALGAIF